LVILIINNDSAVNHSLPSFGYFTVSEFQSDTVHWSFVFLRKHQRGDSGATRHMGALRIAIWALAPMENNRSGSYFTVSEFGYSV